MIDSLIPWGTGSFPGCLETEVGKQLPRQRLPWQQECQPWGNLAPPFLPDLSSWSSWHRTQVLLFLELSLVRGSQERGRRALELRQVGTWREKHLVPVPRAQMGLIQKWVGLGNQAYAEPWPNLMLRPEVWHTPLSGTSSLLRSNLSVNPRAWEPAATVSGPKASPSVLATSASASRARHTAWSSERVRPFLRLPSNLPMVAW